MHTVFLLFLFTWTDISFLPPGQPVQHAFAKELLAGFAGAEADRLFETKGLDFLDR